MRRVASRAATVVGVVLLAGVYAVSAAAEQQDPSVSGAWIRLPAEGSPSTEAYVVVKNPTTYDIDVLGASSDAAGTIELRQAGRDAPLEHVTIPAYGALEMDGKGVYLLLRDLKKPVAEGDAVKLTISTDIGDLTARATVRTH